jgi:filamentous hemagglutinin family protein
MAARLIWAVLASACLPTALGHAQVLPPKPAPISATALPGIPSKNGAPAEPGKHTIVHGAAIETRLNPAGNELTIKQSSTTNIVNWESFNIGKDAKVFVQQPTANSVLLNNVVNTGTEPTVIKGVLKNLESTTPGRVYIYDPRGIVFGSGAQINLNSLIASSLKFDESRIKAGGLLMPGDTPTLAALSAAGEVIPGPIWVQPGEPGEPAAKIVVENGGQIMLAAPRVYNEGTLLAPDGQIILAAGNKVYLSSPDTTKTGTKLRGLVVEVENGITNADTSLAENSGTINVDRGNATMVGYAVNQQGLVSASTSVTMNGSIYLTAKDNTKLKTSRTGNVTLGAGSETKVIPFDDKKTITLAQTLVNPSQPLASIFQKSEVQIDGKSVLLAGRAANGPGAKIFAPGGEVSIKSTTSDANTSLVGDLVRIDLGEGSSIDVSGMSSAKLAMSSNIIEVDLRGTELADNLILRQSPLYGKKVNVDIRKGAPIANIDGWLRLVEYKLDQVNTAGGTISISSGGAVIQRAGSLLNVNGGGVTYEEGYANASQLKLNNSLIDISLAKPNLAYTEVVNLPNSKNNWEERYTQGSKAGSVSISGQVLTLLGDMSGAAGVPSNVLTQFAQRDVSQNGTSFASAQLNELKKITPAYASGGSFNMSVTGYDKTKNQDKDSKDINSFATLIVGNTSTDSRTALLPAVGIEYDKQTITAANTLRLNIADLNQKGFQFVSASVDGNITVNEPVVMLPKGKLSLTANESNLEQGALKVSSSISAPSGTIELTARRTLTIQPDITLSAAGLWTNDASADELSRIVSEEIAGRFNNLLGIEKKTAEHLVLEIKNKLGADLSPSAPASASNQTDISQALLGLRSLGYSVNEASDALNALINKGRGGAISTSGGIVSLKAHEIDLQKGVVLDASAGAWADSWQKIKFGNAGSLELTTQLNSKLIDRLAYGVKLGDEVTFKAEGFSSGGTLTIATPNIYIGSSRELLDKHLAQEHLKGGHSTNQLLQKAQDDHLQKNLLNVAPDSLWYHSLLLTPDFFRQGGFTNYKLMTTSLGDLEILKNTKLNPLATRWVMDSSAIKTASGGMASVAKSIVAPIAGQGDLRSATSLTLNAGGAFLLDTNASLITDPLASMNLLAGTKLTVLGNVTSPGGNIFLGITNDIYDINKSITLGEKANLNVNGGGHTIFTNANGISVGDLLEGGLIRIGGFNTAADTSEKALTPLNSLIIAEKGSSISANGSVGSVYLKRQTIAGIVETTTSSNAGRIDIQSKQGLILAGSLSGLAGANAVGGTLNLVLDSPSDLNELILNISSTSVASKIAKNLSSDGNGWVSFSTLTSGGFGRLQLQARDAISFDLGNSEKTTVLALSSRDAIVLDTPVLRTGSSNNLVISAPSVELGGNRKKTILEYNPTKADLTYLSPTPEWGAATFTVKANTLDLIGTTSLKGFGVANLNSTGDIRLTQINRKYISESDEVIGERGSNPEMRSRMSGVFAVEGDLTLKSSQIYPTTLSDFELLARNDLTFLSNGSVAPSVYSGGGSLTALATNIYQSGVVKAPLGKIILGDIRGDLPTQKLEYSATSVTSVKGEATIIFGGITNGSVATASAWNIYLPGNPGKAASLLLEGANLSTTFRRSLPEKEIVSQAKSVNVKSGALLDASPGGELLAYEFTPGGGGSKDVLTNPNTFAILPSYQSSSAPIDPNNTDVKPQIGDKIYLSASGGLTAGVYTLLPAHFALLPGGYSVQIQPNTVGMTAKSNYALPDGSMLVAGSRLSASQSSGNSYGFQVTSSDVINNKSQFTKYNVNDYFKQQAQINLLPLPELPNDSGYMQILASNSLVLDGTMRMPSGVLDLSVLRQSIKISAEGSAANNTFNAVRLNEIQASSLLIGGVRTSIFDVNRQRSYIIGQLSKKVELANSSGTTLTANDIILTAIDEVKLNAGSSLAALDKPEFDVPQLQLTDGGALLRATGGASINVVRSAPQLTVGLLDIAETANIKAGGALYLDATHTVSLNGRLPLPTGGFLGIASNEISFGDAQIPSAGVSMASNALANADLKAITLTAYGQNPISFAGAVNIGQTSLSNLTINATGLAAKDAIANVALTAQTVQMNGVKTDGSPSSNIQSNSKLNIYADDILIGNDQFAVTGFENSRLMANQTIRATGDQGSMFFAGTTVLVANTFTADSAKSALFESLGSMTLKKPDVGVASGALSSVGGSLAFTAPTLISSAYIVLPSGTINFTGKSDNFTSKGDVTIDNGSLSVAGASKLFGVDAQGNEMWAYAPAGEIAIAGNSITLNGGSFDVSAKSAAAGSLSFKTNSTNGDPAFTFDLSAVSFNRKSDNPNQAQGQFALQTNALGSSFSALNAKINQAGFNQALTYRLTQDDISIASLDTLTAKNITLVADNGNIFIDGKLDARGWIGGNISVYAARAAANVDRGNIYVNGTIDVSSTFTTSSDPASVNLGKGGKVLLSTATLDGAAPTLGATVFLQGGEILAKGITDDLNGSVLIRVPRTNNNSQLALYSTVSTNLKDAKVTLEGFKVYRGETEITEASIGLFKTEAESFRFNVGNNFANFTIRPGVEIRSVPNLTVKVNEKDSDPSKRGWDLSGWRFGSDSQPINLTLRSAGDLTIYGSISDGFDNPGVRGTSGVRAGMAMPNWALGSGPSADINIIAGADFSSANTLATNFNKLGNFTLGFADRVADPSLSEAPVTAYDMPVALLRTGTGNINIAAAKDVVLKLMSINQLVDKVDEKTKTGNIVVFDHQAVLNESERFTIKSSVTVVGASIYTAGENAPDTSAIAKPLNLLNLHYVGDAKKAKSNIFTQADFSNNGGSLTVQAGGNVQGPIPIERKNWYYLNNDNDTELEIKSFVADAGGKEKARIEALANIKKYTADTVNYGSVSQEPIFVRDKENGDYYVITFNRLSTQDWLPTSVSPLVNTWLFRQGRSSLLSSTEEPNRDLNNSFSTAWWVRTDYFNQSMATLGGGNLLIKANGSIKDIYASTATNAYKTTDIATGGEKLLQLGGGDLTMLAKGDLAGVAVYVEKGVATLVAQESITSGGNWVFDGDSSKSINKISGSASDPRVALNSIFAIGDARLNLTAHKNISIGSIYNPTLAEQSVFNRSDKKINLNDDIGFNNENSIYYNRYPILGNGNLYATKDDILKKFESEKDALTRLNLYPQFSNFSTYSEASGVNSLSLGGNVLMINDHIPVAWSGMNMVTNELASSGLDRFYTVAPGRSFAVAMNGDLVSSNGLVMMASKQGQLAWWARDKVSIQNGINGNSGALRLLDVAPESLSNANSPRIFTQSDLVIYLDGTVSNFTTHANVPLYQGNLQTASIVSLNGDVVGDANYPQASFNIPKATTVLAGRDILNLGFTVQNNNSKDITLLRAGRDIRDETLQGKDCTKDACLKHLVSGPGVFRLIAGRDIDLGNQSGVVTNGNQNNPYLQVGGASIELMTAGLTPDYLTLNKYINTIEGRPNKTSVLDLWNASYASASSTTKNKYFFQMLDDDSRDYKKSSKTQVADLAFFDGLVGAMFPKLGKNSLGDLSSHSSQIKTEQGGSIDMFVPAGSVFAGLTMGKVVESPSKQGIFTISNGDINALVYRDFLVNQGRVFTLGGGDIALVSIDGNLEAGKGAKTASSAPPPLVTSDVNGNIKVDVSYSIAGSGIATLSTRSGQKPSNVYVVTPRGVFDAGDAGVRSTGSVKITAYEVKNADNIVATGTISNSQAPAVAPTPPPPVASPPPPATANPDDMKRSLASNTTLNATLSVELLGLGDGKSDNANTSSQANSDEEDKDNKDGKDKPKDKP